MSEKIRQNVDMFSKNHKCSKKITGMRACVHLTRNEQKQLHHLFAEAFFVFEELPCRFQLARVLGHEIRQEQRDYSTAAFRSHLASALWTTPFLLHDYVNSDRRVSSESGMIVMAGGVRLMVRGQRQ